MDYRCLALQDRSRRGSLPFKKRKLNFPQQGIPPLTTNQTAFDDASSKQQQIRIMPRSNGLADLPEHTIASISSGNNEKIAALALVAAAAAASTGATSVTSTYSNISSPPPSQVQRLPLQLPAVFVSPQQQPISSVSLMMPKDDKQQGKEEEMGGYQVPKLQPSTKNTPTKRVPLPPLAKPLPGGCHGRTSRTNSYCRRQPCYNGSKYCKLHYQHYVVAGIRTPLEDKEVCTVISTTASSTSLSSSSSSLADRPAVTSAPTQQQQQQQQQDRRFTPDSIGETRCRATTTRGRDCAYVAVNGTKYCYLHADYDINPPPRRGCAKSKSDDASSSSSLGKENLTVLGSHTGTSLRSPSMSAAEVVSISSPPSVTSEESSRLPSPSPPTDNKPRAKATKSRRRVPSKQAAEHNKDSPFPLLSTISTDQWFGKSVRVSTGPMAKRVGTVEKWGNGWVSVRIPGVGLHNRRSFELYLEQENAAAAEQGIKKCAGNSNSNDDNEILRCVSTEAISPSPTSSSDSDATTTTGKHIRCTARSFHVPSSSSDGEEAPRRFQASRPERVPDTPRPGSNDESAAKNGDGTSGLQGRVAIGAAVGFETPVPERTSIKTDGAAPIPEVTPSVSPRKVRTELPLVESLVLAEEGGTKKYNLDMLFGTAALERSRRTIHKPTRYEDTAMIAKKRSRKVSLEAADSCSKKCSGADNKDGL